VLVVDFLADGVGVGVGEGGGGATGEGDGGNKEKLPSLPQIVSISGLIPIAAINGPIAA